MAKDIRARIPDNEMIIKGRERIARGAIKAIVKKGYSNTTTREIADACGMSEGAMYNYVGTKSDILHMISELLDRFGVQFKEMAEGLKDINRKDALCECWRYYTLLVDREQDMIMISNRETVNMTPEDRAKRVVEPWALGVFEEILRDGIESGEFAYDNPKLLACDMWTSAHDWALKRWLLRRHCNLEQYTEWHLENFLRLLGVDTGQSLVTKEKSI